MSEALIFQLRSYQPGDRAEVTLLAERIKENGIPPWRDPQKARAWHDEATQSIFAENEPGDATIVAEAEAGGLLGFVTLRSNRDFLTGEEQGYVSDFAVAQAAEGRGVAGALMSAAEEWALAQGSRRISLNVWLQNERARGLYEHLGYRPETMHYLKELQASGPARSVP